MALKPQPAKNYRRPKYPTSLSVRANPDLLWSHLPQRWTLDRKLQAAAAMVVAAGISSACSTDKPQSVTTNEIPIFVHGKGRATVACVVVNQPVFLSEEEARQLIEEELAAAGLRTVARNIHLPHLRLRERNRVGTYQGKKYLEEEWWKLKIDCEQVGYLSEEEMTGAFELDGMTDQGIGWEFISSEDSHKYAGLFPPDPKNTPDALSEEFLTLYLARALRAEIMRKNPEQRVVIFYDPLEVKFMNFGIKFDMSGIYGDDYYPSSCTASPNTVTTNQDLKRCMDDNSYLSNIYHEPEHIEAREGLSLQVRDFIDWLKAQGAL